MAKNSSNNNFDGNDDDLGDHTLLPATSFDQPAATLAEWFSVPGTTLVDVFPNLQNFAVALSNLGFMNPA
jgi:hypothetical protein